jgi:hypothetical protein
MQTSATTNTGIDRMFQLALSSHLKKKGIAKGAPDGKTVDLAASKKGGDEKGCKC